MTSVECLHIEATDTTPKVVLDQGNKNFLIQGISMPEDAFSFYRPVLNWLADYASFPTTNAEFVLQLEYLNSSSSKMMIEILLRITRAGKDQLIVWKYDETDEEAQESGETFQEIIGPQLVLEAIEG